jgi:hypothetical protein
MTTSNNASAGQGNDKTSSNNVSAAPTLINTAAPATAELRSIGDLSSGYTFTDTAALQTSYSYDSGTDIHTFVLANVAVGAETNSFISGSNFTGPKYRAGLTYSDGTAVSAGDAFSMTVYVESFTPGLVRSYCIAVGVAQTPSSTVLGTMRGSGIYAVTTAAGVPGVGGWEENLGTSTTVASMTKGMGAATFSGTPQKYRNGSAFGVMSAASGNASNRLGGGQFSVADGTQLGLVVCVGTNGTVAATGGSISVRLRYALTKLS